jgi:ribonuclease VapC
VILDSSAVIAVFLQEPAYDALLHKIDSATSRAIGTPTLAEAGIVLTSRLQRSAIGLVSRFVQALDIVTVPFVEEHWQETVDAFDRFGRGRHPASLNFGDCMTYAVAKLSGEPLLCMGADFAKTDLEIA